MVTVLLIRNSITENAKKVTLIQIISCSSLIRTAQLHKTHFVFIYRSTVAQMAERAATNSEVSSSSPRPGSRMRSCFKKSILFDITLLAEDHEPSRGIVSES